MRTLWPGVEPVYGSTTAALTSALLQTLDCPRIDPADDGYAKPTDFDAWGVAILQPVEVGALYALHTAGCHRAGATRPVVTSDLWQPLAFDCTRCGSADVAPCIVGRSAPWLSELLDDLVWVLELLQNAYLPMPHPVFLTEQTAVVLADGFAAAVNTFLDGHDIPAALDASLRKLAATTHHRANLAIGSLRADGLARLEQHLRDQRRRRCIDGPAARGWAAFQEALTSIDEQIRAAGCAATEHVICTFAHGSAMTDVAVTASPVSAATGRPAQEVLNRHRRRSAITVLPRTLAAALHLDHLTGAHLRRPAPPYPVVRYLGPADISDVARLQITATAALQLWRDPADDPTQAWQAAKSVIAQR